MKEPGKGSASNPRGRTTSGGARAVAAASSPPSPSQPRRHQRASSPPPRPRPGAPKVIVLAGPTASGKSAVSLRLAGMLLGGGGGEVVNADSVQVYRGLDVGSAKLPPAERRGVPHHLLDVAEPLSEDFSAGSFYTLAREAIEDILARGKTPIVVGGTGLYLRWLVHGRPSTKPSSERGRAWARRAVDDAVASAEAAKRREIGGGRDGGDGGGSGGGGGGGSGSSASVLTKEERWAAACSALRAAGDPVAAERVFKERNNEYRLLRALAALFEAGPGVTLASLEAPGLVGGVKKKKNSKGKGKEGNEEAGDDDDDGGDDDASAAAAAAASSSSSSPPSSSSSPLLDYDFRCFFLHAPTREAAYRRIDARAEGIVAGGLLAEAATLLARGALPASNSATRAIGYRQAMEGILDVLGRGGGDRPGAGGPSPARDDVRAVAAATQAASRRLAHSQYTWFRGDPLYRWVSVPVLAPSSSSGGGGGAGEGRGSGDEGGGDGGSGGSGEQQGEEEDPVALAAEEIAASFALAEHDPSGTLDALPPSSRSSSPSSSSSPPRPPPSDGRLTKEEEQALRRYVPRLTLLSTERGMRAALASFSAAVASMPEEVARAAREEAAKRRRQRESTL